MRIHPPNIDPSIMHSLRHNGMSIVKLVFFSLFPKKKLPFSLVSQRNFSPTLVPVYILKKTTSLRSVVILMNSTDHLHFRPTMFWGTLSINCWNLSQKKRWNGNSQFLHEVKTSSLRNPLCPPEKKRNYA